MADELNTEIAPSLMALYEKIDNLTDSRSPRLQKIANEEQTANDIIEKTTIERKELEEKIKSLNNKKDILNAEGKSLKADLEGLKRSDYETILEELNQSFDPENIVKIIKEELPKLISEIEAQLESAKTELKNVEQIAANAKLSLEELAKTKEKELSLQKKLNSYVVIAVEGKKFDEPRSIVEDLYLNLGFSKEEAFDATIETMFPERGFQAFFSKLLGADKKDMRALFGEINELKNQEAKVVEAEVLDEKNVSNDALPLAEEIEMSKPVVEEMDIEIIEPQMTKNEVIEFLNALEFNHNFKDKDLQKIIDANDFETIKANINFAAKDKDLTKMLSDVSHLIDKDFISKINLLTSLEKSFKDIKNRIEILNFSVEQLEQKIKSIQKIDPKRLSLGALSNIENLNEIIKLFQEYNIIITENDLEKSGPALANIDLKKAALVLELLLHAQIISKDSNQSRRFIEIGTGLFYQDILGTEKNIEILKNAGHEELYKSKPKYVLVNNNSKSILERITFLENNHRIIKDPKKGYAPYVYDSFAFNKELETIKLENPEADFTSFESENEKNVNNNPKPENVNSTEQIEIYRNALQELRSLNSSKLVETIEDDMESPLGKGVV